MGSEMCIRDSVCALEHLVGLRRGKRVSFFEPAKLSTDMRWRDSNLASGSICRSSGAARGRARRPRRRLARFRARFSMLARISISPPQSRFSSLSTRMKCVWAELSGAPLPVAGGGSEYLHTPSHLRWSPSLSTVS